MTSKPNQFTIDTAMLQSYHEFDHLRPISNFTTRVNEKGLTELVGIDLEQNVVWFRPNETLDSGWEKIQTGVKLTILEEASHLEDGSASRIFGSYNLGGNLSSIKELVFDEANGRLEERKICEVSRSTQKGDWLKCGVCEHGASNAHFLVLSGGKGNWTALINPENGEWFFTYVPREYKGQQRTYSIAEMEAHIRPMYEHKSCGVWPEVGLISIAGGRATNINPPIPVYNTQITATEVFPYPDVMEPLPGKRDNIAGHPAITYKTSTLANPSEEVYTYQNNGFCTVEKGDELHLFAIPSLLYNTDPEETIIHHCVYKDGAWSPLERIGSALHGTPKSYEITQLHAAVDQNGCINLSFYSHSRFKIYHCAQINTDDWTSWLPLAENVFSYAVGKDGNGLLQFFDEIEGGLRMIHQPEALPSDDQDAHLWTDEIILVETADTKDDQIDLFQGECYRSTITAFDENQEPVKAEECTVSVSDYLPCFVNGKYRELNPGVGYKINTNQVGQINIEYILKDTLFSPSFAVTHDALFFQIECVPDELASGYLANNLSIEDFDTARTKTQILPKDKDTQENKEVVLKAVQNAASHLQAAQIPSSIDPKGLIGKNVKLGSVHYIRPKDYIPTRKIDTSRITSQPIRFSFAGDHFSTETLSHEQYNSILKETPNGAHLIAGNVGGIFDWFGDLWEAIKEHALGIIWDGLKATIEFVIEGVKYIVTHIVEHARDLFDVLGCILDALGTIMATVVVWVLELLDFLFDWDAIIRTKEEIKSGFKSGINELDKYLNEHMGDLAMTLKNLGKEAKENYAQGVDRLHNGEAGSYTAKQFDINIRSEVFTLGDNCFWNSGTWLINEVIDRLFTSFLPSPPSGIADKLVALVDKTVGVMKGQPDFDAFKEKLNGILSDLLNNPSALFSDTMDKIAEILNEVWGLLISLYDGCVNALAEFILGLKDLVLTFLDWLDTPIHIPFVSTFYKGVIKSECTILDICCLITAIPYSVISSSLQGEKDADKKGEFGVSAVFTTVSALFSGISSFSGKKTVIFWILLAKLCSLMGSVFMIVACTPKVVWKAITNVLSLIASVGGLMLVVTVKTEEKYKQFNNPILIFTGLLGIASAIVAIVKDNDTYLSVGNILAGVKSCWDAGASYAGSESAEKWSNILNIPVVGLYWTNFAKA